MNNYNLNHWNVTVKGYLRISMKDINVFAKIKVGIKVFWGKSFCRGNFSQGKSDDKFINKCVNFLKNFPQ